MRSSLQKAKDWFDINNYKQLNDCPDFALFKFLFQRAEFYWQLTEFIGKHSNDSAFFNAELNYIREEEPAYRKIKFFSLSDYFSCGHNLDSEMDSFGWTPTWLKEQGYSCTSVRPLSIGGVVGFTTDLDAGVPRGYTKDEFANAIDEARLRFLADGETSPDLESISMDQFMREIYEYHSGIASFQIDLAARDEQIILELKSLLPKLREFLYIDQEKNTHNESLLAQPFMGPSSQFRDTRKIDLTKVRDYRVSALIDLFLWSAVEKEELSSADYLRLVFPGDTESDGRISEANVGKTYLPYAIRCMDLRLLAALDRSLEFARKSTKEK